MKKMNLQRKVSVGANKYSARKEITEQLRIRQSFERKLNIQSVTDTKYSVSIDSIYSKI